MELTDVTLGKSSGETSTTSGHASIEEEFIHKNDQDKDYMPHPGDVVYIAYKWRWVNLLLFALCNLMNMIAWISISPIATEIHENYSGVSLIKVNNLSTVYQAIYVVFTFPSTFFINSYGVRNSTILGIFFTAAGCGVKCFVNDSFDIMIFG